MKRIASIAGSMMLTVLGVQVVTASPASASWSQCPAERFCVWKGSGGTGSFAYFAIGSADLRNPIGGVVFDNSITSVWNRTTVTWCLYLGYDYTPAGLDVRAGTKNDLNNIFPQGSFNNTVSSLRREPGAENAPYCEGGPQ